MICSQCGAPVSDTAGFCTSCGSQMTVDTAVSSIQDITQESTVQSDTQEPSKPPKPKLGKGKKIVILVLVGVIVLLGVFTALAATLFPRDALIFILGEERFTRNMFRGSVVGFSGYLIEQLPDMLDNDMDIDIGELTLNLSLDATSETGAVERLSNDLAFFNHNVVGNLGALAASSVNITAVYDISGQSPLLNLNSSWSVMETDNTDEEILNLDIIAIDNSIYLRLRQLLNRYIGVNLGDFGVDLSGIGDFSNIFDIINLGTTGISFSDIERFSDFIDENEQELNAMISDSADVFFSSFDNMRVDRNVPVSVSGETVNLHRAVITADWEDVLFATADMLRMIRDNETYTFLLFDTIRTLNPHFDYTYRDFLEELDSLIESWEDEAYRFADDNDFIDFYLYINRSSRIVGFGYEILEYGGFLNFVVVEDIGYDFAFELNNTYIRLHGFWDSDRHVTTGDMHLIVRHNNPWQLEETVVEGKLLDFEFGSGFVAINMSGENISWLIGDNTLPDARTVDLLNNLELAFVMTFSDTDVDISFDIKLLHPEISVSLLASHRKLDYVSITAPQSDEISNINLQALMRGNVFAMLRHLRTLREIYNNLQDFAETLNRLGFDGRGLLIDLLDEFLQGLF